MSSNALLAGLATCDPTFSLKEWDRLLQQVDITINLLRNSRLNPRLSAWVYLFGNFSFSKCPLLPPGTKMILHAKPGKRVSWTFHGEQGCYIGPAINHYQCITFYIPKTQREIIIDAAKLIPRNIPIPQANYEDHLRHTADDWIHLLEHEQNLLLPQAP